MILCFRREAESRRRQEALLEIYKLLVEMADRVSQRRQAANNFYLSVNTALVGISAYFETKSSTLAPISVCFAGCLISILWSRAIESYRSLNKAKFEVIHEIEKRLSFRPFTSEWAIIDPQAGSRRHLPFYRTERVIPRVFVMLYILQIGYFLPWSQMFAQFNKR